MDQHRQRLQTQSLIRGIVKARSRRAKGSVNNLCNFWCPLIVLLVPSVILWQIYLIYDCQCELWSYLCMLWYLWAVPVPSCADIRGTFPSAWTSSQLSRMSQEDLKQCVEVFAQDASMSPEQRRALWMKLRKVCKTLLVSGFTTNSIQYFPALFYSRNNTPILGYLCAYNDLWLKMNGGGGAKQGTNAPLELICVALYISTYDVWESLFLKLWCLSLKIKQ